MANSPAKRRSSSRVAGDRKLVETIKTSAALAAAKMVASAVAGEGSIKKTPGVTKSIGLGFEQTKRKTPPPLSKMVTEIKTLESQPRVLSLRDKSSPTIELPDSIFQMTCLQSSLARQMGDSVSPCGADVVYINLESRLDRRRNVEKQLTKHGISGTRFEARTGASADNRVVTRSWDSTLNCRYDKNTLPAIHVMSPGELGCSMSHATIWRACAARGIGAPPILVLEDDIVLYANFTKRCSKLIRQVESAFSPAEPVLLYLGADVMAWRESAASNQVHAKVGSSMREAEYLYQTSSYIIWPSAARVLLASMPINAPVDCFMSQQLLARKLRAMVATPQICRQAEAYCDGDIDHTNIYVWEKGAENRAKTSKVTGKAVVHV